MSAVVDECHDSERGGRTSCSASAAVSGILSSRSGFSSLPATSNCVDMLFHVWL